jgi:hypothetical protein
LREIADVLIAEAKAGNIQAIRELADRLDGKPVPTLELSGPGGGSTLERRKLTYEIVHVTRDEIDARDRERERDLDLDDYEVNEVKAIDGNGHNHADSEKAANGDGHEQQE